ncbi:unnamed protein product, partial [marine sediment metagenome]
HYNLINVITLKALTKKYVSKDHLREYNYFSLKKILEKNSFKGLEKLIKNDVFIKSNPIIFLNTEIKIVMKCIWGVLINASGNIFPSIFIWFK